MNLERNQSSMCIDLENCKLDKFPTKVYDCQNLRMLCLSNNSLTHIPDDFFLTVTKLKWFDIRNNQLTFLPHSIGRSQMLETLLIQNNNIQELPIELAFLTKLKIFHFAGNPITNPTDDILQKGLTHILQYLRNKLNGLQIKYNDCSKNGGFYEISTEDITSTRIKKCARQISKQCMRTKQIFSGVLQIKPLKKCSSGIIQRHVNTPCSEYGNRKLHTQPILPKRNSDRYIKAPGANTVKRHELRVEENELREIWTYRLRILLEQQAAVIQRRKTIEALKNWRLQANGAINSINKLGHYELTPPFDIDPIYMHMMDRDELLRDQANFNNNVVKWQRLPNQEKRQQKDFCTKIDQIIKSLNVINNLSKSTMSPEQERKLLDLEIKKLNGIQKSLKELQITNQQEF